MLEAQITFSSGVQWAHVFLMEAGVMTFVAHCTYTIKRDLHTCTTAQKSDKSLWKFYKRK